MYVYYNVTLNSSNDIIVDYRIKTEPQDDSGEWLECDSKAGARDLIIKIPDNYLCVRTYEKALRVVLINDSWNFPIYYYRDEIMAEIKSKELEKDKNRKKHNDISSN